MKSICTTLAVALALMVAGPVLSSADQTSLSGVADQETVAVTVYNNNLGLVREVRRVALPKGEGELRFMDVAAHINPATVHAKSLNSPKRFSVLEQNYAYDLMNADRLLDKYVGRKIRLMGVGGESGPEAPVEAVLLSNNKGQIYEIGGEIYLGHPGIRVLPEIPENLIAQPTLTWLYRNESAEPHRLEVSYLTQQINWRADYVMVLNDTDTAGDLTGWVTLDNRSGATYKNARLKLVAGDVNRVREEAPERMMAMDTVKAARAPQFKSESFFEYHVYDLQRRTTIKDRQTKQVKLLEAAGAGVEKTLRVESRNVGFTRHLRDVSAKLPVTVTMVFKNATANRLGMPLPAGIVRLYKADSSGGLQFVGEDRIEHTPENETVRLKTGEAFDVVAERTQTDYRQISKTQHASTWKISLRNHKKTDVTVSVVEPVYGNWRVVENSHPYRKTSAFTLAFDVELPADGEVDLTYGIRVGL